MAILAGTLHHLPAAALHFFPGRGLFFLRTRKGLLVLKMPSFFFFKCLHSGWGFLFHRKAFFASFLAQISFFTHRLIYYLRLKVRGLGYRIKEIAFGLYRFFIGTCNWYFFHSPPAIHVRVRRRRMLLASLNPSVLRLVFSHLLLLRRIVPYKLRGAFFPRQIILMKPGKKSF